MSSPTDQHQGVGSTEAQIARLAGGLGNTNVNGTVGPHFFVARLKNEATIVALYGYLLSDECCLGLQGEVQLPEGVNCASDFLELFRKKDGVKNSVQAVSFGKIHLRNVRKDKPDEYGFDGEWEPLPFNVPFFSPIAPPNPPAHTPISPIMSDSEVHEFLNMIGGGWDYTNNKPLNNNI